MMTLLAPNKAQRGFSLLEVLIAVVVLSTGLLALAALQGSLTRNSADAKVRSQVAALLQARMDQIRTTGYSSIPVGTVTDSCATNETVPAANWVPKSFCDQNGLSSMTGNQITSLYSSAVGGSFATPGDATDPAQFKRIEIRASWNDATGTQRQLALTSDISELGLINGIIIPPTDSSTGGQMPIVRQASPATAGVIPIAIGGNDATAATNPRPEILGQGNNQSIVGTKFNVLTYTNETGGVRIQKRIENSLIACKCKYGAAGTNFVNLPEIYRKAQWPAIWDGDTYTVYKPDSTTAAAPGQSLESGEAPGVEQSDLCMECCRDHHDNATTGVAKFDPERLPYASSIPGQSDTGIEKYDLNNSGGLVKVTNTSSGTYIDACRVIRVDGIQRVAADTYRRHFGLLATETVSSKAAATGVPNTTATTAYQQFVKDYLAGYSGTATPSATDADTKFNDSARGLNNPTSISIARPTPVDERYLHARGLYVDHLEQAARDKLTFELNNCTTTPTVECILPFLPFNTVNVTELAFWYPTALNTSTGARNVLNNTTLSVASGSSLIYDPLQPTRGRTNALSSSANGDTADATAYITPSNAGLAISGGVDPLDDVDADDSQTFVVSASGSGSGSNGFQVVVTGLPQTSDTNTSNDPAISWLPASGIGANCNSSTSTSGNPKDYDPNSYSCDSTTATKVQIANYYVEATSNISMTASCTNGGSSYSVTATISVPVFKNYQVDSAAFTGTTAALGVSNDGKKTEVTTADFGSVIPANAVVTATFSLTQTLQATIASCTTNGGHNQINGVVWNKPWETP